MRYLNGLGYLAIPLAFLVHFAFHDKSWQPGVTFLLAGLGVIPLARLMGEATEHLSERAGPTWGGLLNATFGNAAELIIGVIALTKGLNDIVKASLTGSILGNLLLVAGAAMLVGGWNREKQTFNRSSAETSGGLLALSVAAMIFPALFHFSYHFYAPGERQREHNVSLGVSLILLVVYVLGLVFTLKTHAHIFSPRPSQTPEDPPGVAALRGGSWSVRRSIGMLLLASVGIGVVAELLVGSAQLMAERMGWNPIFVGVILLAIIGNAAEHSTALMLARRNDMDTAMTITYQSSVQIALFVTPVLVLVSAAMAAAGVKGAVRLDLVFSPMEVVAVLLTAAIVIVLGMNGETNWFEGVLLLALYAILAITFFYIPQAAGKRIESGAEPTGPAAEVLRNAPG